MLKLFQLVQSYLFKILVQVMLYSYFVIKVFLKRLSSNGHDKCFQTRIWIRSHIYFWILYAHSHMHKDVLCTKYTDSMADRKHRKGKKIKAYHLAWHSWSIIILLLGLTIVVCQLIVLSVP